MDKLQQYNDLYAAIGLIEFLRTRDRDFFKVRGHDYDAAKSQVDALLNSFAPYEEKQKRGKLTDGDKPAMKALASKARKLSKRLNQVKRK